MYNKMLHCACFRGWPLKDAAFHFAVHPSTLLSDLKLQNYIHSS